MTSKLQIFVSSTYQDLIKERQAAVEAILKAGHIPAGMELFTAGDKSQWEVIQRWISDSDIYMLILGGRYGSIEPNSGISYTEMEYDFAVASSKPFFAVVIADEELEAREKKLGTLVSEKEHLDKLKAFREKVLSKISSFFSDYKDVKVCVLETIPQLVQEYEIKGWVRASQIPDTKGLTDEITNLLAENSTLREQNTILTKRIDELGSSAISREKEFDELIDMMSKIPVDITEIKSRIENKEKLVGNQVTLIDLALTFKDTLMRGVTNSIGISDVESFIFFTLCPKLQTYELMQNEKVTGVRYRRYAITPKGIQFFAYFEKKLLKQELHAKKLVSKVKPK